MRSSSEKALSRLPALDGLRGILALTVVCYHVALIDFGGAEWAWIGRGCVMAFFALSAHVLTRAWGAVPFHVFLARRAVRLWPVYALCVVIGAAVQSVPLQPAALVWLAPHVDADVPAWSLVIEAWAALAMPLIAWSSGGSLLRSVGVGAAWLLVTHGAPLATCGIAFLVGARLSRFDMHADWLEGRTVQWLGKVSYSLYLTHWIVLAVLPWWLALPAIPLVAWDVWWMVERPSIAWSRMIGRSMRIVLA